MKTKQAFCVAVLVAGCFFGSSSWLSAQSRVWQQRPGWTNSFFHDAALASLPGATQVLTNILTSPVPTQVVTTQSFVRLPAGLYWSLQGLTNHSAGPLPSSPFGTNVPVYALSSNQFVFDDRSVNYAALMAAAQEAELTNSFSAQNNSPGFDSQTALWLNIPPGGLDETNLTVIVHNTSPGLAYMLLTKAALNDPVWTGEQLLYGDERTETAAQLSRNGRTNLFVWAKTGGGLMIYQQPLSQVVFVPDTVTFSVVASGPGTLSYQWTCNGTNIPGATTSSYTLNSVRFSDAGDYAVRVSNGTDALLSQTAHLWVPYYVVDKWTMGVIGQRQDYNFKDGITYYVGSEVQFYGATVIHGGSVIKFDPDYAASMVIHGSLSCDTQPYYPAILTSIFDQVGEMWVAGNLEPAFNGVPYLNLNDATSADVKNLRISYADLGISTPWAARQLEVWDCQFFNCNYGVVNTVPGSGAVDCLHNVLFANCGVAVGAVSNAIAITAEQVTADVGDFWLAYNTPNRIALTNSIIGGNNVTAASLATVNVAFNPAATNFQTAGAGIYYLAANSPFHHGGTAGISPRLQSELKAKTTCPPLAFPALMRMNADITLFPQVARYTNGAPDLGYYYDALDYTVAYMFVTGGRLTVAPGTSVGFRNDYMQSAGPMGNHQTTFGFDVWQGAAFLSQGTAARPNSFVDAQFVQEQWSPPVKAYFQPDFWPSENEEAAPMLDFRFSNFYTPRATCHVWSGGDFYYQKFTSPDSVVDWTMQDCQLRGGRICLGLPDFNWRFGFPPDFFYGTGQVTWRNNLFDNVCIDLEPSLYPWNQATNCDISFHASNNLFRGGQWWFIMEPLPATAGNWTFTDNLFDKVHLLQDTNMPLIFDYNAYWPLTKAEMPWTDEAGQLRSAAGGNSGLGEVTLTAAPSYQAGPLGNYYLPMLTPLYHAGSRLAGDAGLSQYTTRPDQITEGDDYALFHGNVNIGLHYVATSNSPSLKFKDSDGDGIPDYVEDANGNGVVDGSETDPHNTMTDGVTNDLYNVAYDDVDLSGNGMVGRIKKALGIHPLDPNNLLTLKQVITGEEPDIATFEVPVSYDAVTSSGTLNLNMNGIDVTLEECTRATNGNCQLSFNVDFDPAGLHYLSAGFRLGTEPPAELHPVMTASGVVMPFVSSNTVQFFESGSMFDNTSAYLDAKVFLPSADYTIELYNPATTPPTLIATITNSTTSGMIQEEWDLTAADGSHYPGSSINAAYIVTPPGGNGNAPTNKPTKTLTRAAGSLSEWGPNFDVAYMYEPTNSALAAAYGQNGEIWNGMLGVVDTLLSPVTVSGGNAGHYDSLFDRYSSRDFPGQPGIPGYVTSRAQVTNSLLPDMTNGLTKQIYISGHGTNGWMGNGSGDVYLSAQEVGQALNNHYSMKKLTSHNPYRFVFLDGCATASGKDWRRAFGIYPLDAQNQASHNKTGPQAYVGWAAIHDGWLNNTAGSSSEITMAQAYSQTLNNFYSDWMHGKTLKQCIDNATVASSGTAPLLVPKNKNVTIWGNGYRWSFTNLDVSKIYIVGFPGLRVSGVDFNLNQDKTYAAPVNAE